MLQFLNDGAKGGLGKIIIFGFIGLGAASLVLTDVQGFFSGGVSARNVAKVAGSEISVQEYDARLRLSLQSENITPQEAHALGYTGQILQAMVGETLLKKATIDYGLVVPRERVAQDINKMLENVVNENLTKEEALQRILRAQRLSEQKFIQGIGQETATRLLNRALFETVYTPEALAKDLKLYDDHTRDIKVVFFKNATNKDIGTPSEEDLRAFYALRKNIYAIPEYRSFSYAVLDTDHIQDQTNISDENLKTFYDENIDVYTTPEQRQVAQAIVTSAEDARSILTKVTEGTSLSDATEAVTGSKNTYRAPDWFEQKGLFESISTPVFEAELGTTLEPIKSPLGWHVVKILTSRPAKTKSFASVKEEIRKTLKQETLSDALFELSEEIDDALAGGEALESIAPTYNLKLKETPMITLGGVSKKGIEPFKEFTNAAEILNEGFDLQNKESSQLIETNSGEYIALQVKNVEPKGYEAFENVKSKLTTAWREDEKRKHSFEQASVVLEKLRENENATLEDAAKEVGTKVLRITNLKNNNKSQDILSAENVRQIFTLDPENDTQIFVNPQGNGIAILDKINVRKTPVLDKDIKQRAQDLKTGFRESVYQTYLYALYSQYNVKINTDALNQLYARRDDENY